MKVCQNCLNEITGNAKTCPYCIEEFRKEFEAGPNVHKLEFIRSRKIKRIAVSILIMGTLFIFMIPSMSITYEKEINLIRIKEDAKNILLEALSDDNYFDVQASIYLIARLNLDEFAYKLEDLYEKAGDFPPMRWEICATLAHFGNIKYIDQSARSMNTEKGLKRIEAAYVHVLLEIRPEEAKRILRNAVYGEDLYEVQTAVEALAQVKDPLAYEYLIGGLKHNDKIIQLQCAMTLTRGKWNDGIDILKDFFRNGNDDEKQRAATGLSRLNDEMAINYMIFLLNSNNSAAQLQATIALGASSNVAARDPLEKFIQNERKGIDVRVSALRALGNIGNKDSIPIIEKTLRSKVRILSIASAGAIIQIIDGKKLEMDSPTAYVAR